VTGTMNSREIKMQIMDFIVDNNGNVTVPVCSVSKKKKTFKLCVWNEV